MLPKIINDFAKEENINIAFAANYLKLKEWHKNNKDCWPSARSNNEETKSLGRWCADIRKAYKKDKLSSERIKLLEEISFEWKPLESHFQNMYKKLKEWHKNNKDCWPSTISKNKEEKILGRWCFNIRIAYKKDKLSPEKIKLLEEINFEWNIFESNFQNMYKKLKEWHKNNYDRWPSRCSKNKEEKILGTWCFNIMIAYKKDKLSLKRMKMLKEINFTFSKLENINSNQEIKDISAAVAVLGGGK